MDKIVYDILTKIEETGSEAYLIGGYVREHILKNEPTLDVDITTSAKPKDIVELFKDNEVKLYEYGSVTFTKEKHSFDITTFRKDINYLNNRKPEKIEYISSLKEDIKRRDFTINTICLDKEENIIDYYDGMKDLKRKIIRSVKDPNKKMSEDALRILRAVRFATTYKFKLEPSLKDAIINNKDLVKELSYERKKEELSKIFCSKHKKYGLKLLKELKLLEPLELKNIDNVLLSNDLIGIWSTITDKDYAFTKKEKELIEKVNYLLDKDINDPFIMYKYGSYLISIASDLKKLNVKKVSQNYDKLPIKGRNEIKITVEEICKILNKEPDNFIKEVMDTLEKEILLGNLINDNNQIKSFIKNNF